MTRHSPLAANCSQNGNEVLGLYVVVTGPDALKPIASTARLLIVEDDNSIRTTVEEALRAEGFEVLACANGTSALVCLTAKNNRAVSRSVIEI